MLCENCKKNAKKIAELKEKNNPIAPEKDETMDCCPICHRHIRQYPSIRLHTFNVKNSKKVVVKNEKGEPAEEKIEETVGSSVHEYHAHCLMSWYNSINEDKKINPFSDGNSIDTTDIDCVQCKQHCQVSISEICKKYLEYWEKLSLKERFAELAIAPPNIVIKILEEVANLSVEERNQICENDASDLIIQHFIYNPVLYKNTVAINAALKILGERKPTLEFMVATIDVVSEEQAIKYLKQALAGPNTTMLSEQVIFELEDSEEEEEEIELEDDINSRELKNKKYIEMYHYEKIYMIFKKTYEKLPAQLQCECFEALTKKAPDDESKTKIRNKFFWCLKQEAKLSCFNTIYPYLDDYEKISALILLKDDLLKAKGKEAVMSLVNTCGESKILWEIYWKLFPLKEQFTRINKVSSAMGLDTFNKFAILSPQEKLQICSENESDLKIQKFIINFCKETIDVNARKETVQLALKILNKRPMTIEFANKIFEYLEESEQDKYFKIFLGQEESNELDEYDNLNLLYGALTPKLQQIYFDEMYKGWGKHRMKKGILTKLKDFGFMANLPPSIRTALAIMLGGLTGYLQEKFDKNNVLNRWASGATITLFGTLPIATTGIPGKKEQTKMIRWEIPAGIGALVAARFTTRYFSTEKKAEFEKNK